MMTLLRTNGTLIDAAMAQRLKRAGVGHVLVDLMGCRAETHDWFAGVAGSFTRACAGIRNLVEAGVKTDVLTILNKRNGERNAGDPRPRPRARGCGASACSGSTRWGRSSVAGAIWRCRSTSRWPRSPRSSPRRA